MQLKQIPSRVSSQKKRICKAITIEENPGRTIDHIVCRTTINNVLLRSMTEIIQNPFAFKHVSFQSELNAFKRIRDSEHVFCFPIVLLV